MKIPSVLLLLATVATAAEPLPERVTFTEHIADVMIDATQRQLDLPENPGKKLAPIAAMLKGFDANGDGKLDDAERAPIRSLIQFSGFPRQMLNASP